MTWFALTPIIDGENLKPEVFYASSLELGLGRAMGRLDERFERIGRAYLTLGGSFRLDTSPGETDRIPYATQEPLAVIIPQGTRRRPCRPAKRRGVARMRLPRRLAHRPGVQNRPIIRLL